MAKNFMSGVKAATVKVKAATGIPGSSSKARLNEAAGQKVTAPTSTAAPVQKRLAPEKVNIASGDNIVMPSEHPNSISTRTVKGSAGF